MIWKISRTLPGAHSTHVLTPRRLVHDWGTSVQAAQAVCDAARLLGSELKSQALLHHGTITITFFWSDTMQFFIYYFNTIHKNPNVIIVMTNSLTNFLTRPDGQTKKLIVYHCGNCKKILNVYLFTRVILLDKGYNPIFRVGQSEQVRPWPGHN